ncbi:MAG: PAS domain-containing protein [Desulfobacterales bacterium]
MIELIRQRPRGISGIIEHNLSWFLRQFYHMNQQLKTSQNRAMLEKMSSDFLIQQSNAAVVMLNTDYTIVEANEAYLKAVGKTKQEVVGAHCYEVSRGLSSPCMDLHAHVSCPMEESLRTGKSAHVIHEHPTGRNHPQFCNMVTYPLKGKDGQILRIIEIWRDITDQIAFSWERRLKALKDDTKRVIQEDRMISLGKLVASCVHEINNSDSGAVDVQPYDEGDLEEKRPGERPGDQFKHYLTLMARELNVAGILFPGCFHFPGRPAGITCRWMSPV